MYAFIPLLIVASLASAQVARELSYQYTNCKVVRQSQWSIFHFQPSAWARLPTRNAARTTLRTRASTPTTMSPTTAVSCSASARPAITATLSPQEHVWQSQHAAPVAEQLTQIFVILSAMNKASTANTELTIVCENMRNFEKRDINWGNRKGLLSKNGWLLWESTSTFLLDERRHCALCRNAWVVWF